MTRSAPTDPSRFVAKKLGPVWGVYDRHVGSWPLSRPELGGAVAQDSRTEEAAQREADRVNGLAGGRQPATAQQPPTAAVPDGPASHDDPGGSGHDHDLGRAVGGEDVEELHDGALFAATA